MDVDLDSKESGDQCMSEFGVDMKVSAGSGKTSDVKFYVLLPAGGGGLSRLRTIGAGRRC